MNTTTLSGRETADMNATILSGKEPAEVILNSLKAKVEKLNPKLVIVQVGEDPASESYIRKKLQSCQSIGMRCEHKNLKSNITFDELLQVIKDLNADKDTSG